MLRRHNPIPAMSLVRICRARDLIRDCYTEPVTLGDCALEAGLSPWHFLRSFRAVFGETPKEFHTRLRLERAKHLLTVTDRSVTEVCYDVGFSSLGTFSVLFKRRVGFSPREFRRRIRCWVTVPGTDVPVRAILCSHSRARAAWACLVCGFLMFAAESPACGGIDRASDAARSRVVPVSTGCQRA
jgi:AraC-like DNA-binding protein